MNKKRAYPNNLNPFGWIDEFICKDGEFGIKVSNSNNYDKILVFNPRFATDIIEQNSTIFILDGLQSLNKLYGFNVPNLYNMDSDTRRRLRSVLYNAKINNVRDIDLFDKLDDFGLLVFKRPQDIHELSIRFTKEVREEVSEKSNLFIPSQYGLDFVIKVKNSNLDSIKELQEKYVIYSQHEYLEKITKEI